MILDKRFAIEWNACQKYEVEKNEFILPLDGKREKNNCSTEVFVSWGPAALSFTQISLLILTTGHRFNNTQTEKAYQNFHLKGNDNLKKLASDSSFKCRYCKFILIFLT